MHMQCGEDVLVLSSYTAAIHAFYVMRMVTKQGKAWRVQNQKTMLHSLAGAYVRSSWTYALTPRFLASAAASSLSCSRFFLASSREYPSPAVSTKHEPSRCSEKHVGTIVAVGVSVGQSSLGSKKRSKLLQGLEFVRSQQRARLKYHMLLFAKDGSPIATYKSMLVLGSEEYRQSGAAE